MAEPREITKAEYARILAGQAAGAEIAETGIVTPGATEIVPPDTQPTIADRMGKAFNRSVEEQGGFGISPETRKKIGFADVLPKSNPASLLLDLPANAVDVGARVLQTAIAGGSALAEGADALTQKAGLDVVIPGVTPDSGFLPGSLAKELINAFPTGSPTTGLAGAGMRFSAPKNDIMEASRRAATNAEAKAMFDRGASADEMQEWAKTNGMKPFGPEIDEAVRIRDSMTVPQADVKLVRADKGKVTAARNKALKIQDLPERAKALAAVDEFEAGLLEKAREAVGASADPNLVDRLTDAIKTAGPVTEEQKALLSQFRSDQAKAMLEARGGKVGEASLNAELGALKGSAPKASFAPVKDKFTQVEVDTLFDSLRENPALSSPFNQLNARTALRKLLEGEVPTPSELELLQKAMPADFIKAAMSRRSTGEKAKSFLEDLVNLPKTMLATGDLSAPLRQGVFLVGRKEFYTAFPEMFKEFGRAWKANDAVELPKRGQNWKSSGSQVFDDIQSRPTYELMERAKLALTRPDGLSLNSREEAFQSRWAEKIPGFGRLVKGSEAAYSGFLNKLRADTFDDLVKKATANGVDLETNEKALKDIAKFVNAATGRGNLAGTFEQGAALLNGAFFSPRLMSSRLSLINPAFYAKLDPTVRKEAVKSLLSFASIAGTVAGLSALGGAEVETDMRSSKFGRVKFGNVSQDLTGGFNGYLTLLSRVLTNEKKTANGDIVPLTGKGVTPSKLDLVETFFENKLAPVPGYVRDMLKGKDPGGTEFDAVGDAAGMFIPLFAQDISEAIAEGSGADVAMMVPGFFGSSARFEGPKKDADGVRTITKDEYEELLNKSQGQDGEDGEAAEGGEGPREISLQEYEEILKSQ